MWDPILFWNDVVLEANRRDHTDSYSSGDQRGPVATSRAFAIVHLAMHDAWFGLHDAAPTPSTYTRLARQVTPASLRTARETAVTTAAATTLLALYPKLKPYIESRVFAGNPPNDPVGGAFGASVAAELLRLREKDGSNDAPPHVPSAATGRHRVDPANPTQGYLGPGWGRVKHFVVNVDPGKAHIDLAPPPGHGRADMLADPAYAKSYAKVQQKGRKTGSTRTPDETTAGIYWGYDGANEIGTPPRLYNQILRTLAAGQGPEDNALLFALANVAMADAGIEAWHWKYHYDLWRPVLGIREADACLGPAGTPEAGLNHAEPDWLPLGAPKSNQKAAPDFTPNFPAYPSGHATFGAAMFQTFRMFRQLPPYTLADIVDKKPGGAGYHFVSDELNGTTFDSAGVVRPRLDRSFVGLAAAIHENSLSRMYLGVHWDFDGFLPDKTPDVGGVPLGLEIARRVFVRGLIQA